MGMWSEQAHPRNMKGPGGGEFKAGSTAANTSKMTTAKTLKGKRPAGRSGGTLSYNGKTGTGYGSKHGDPRVRKLQQALNRMGLKDSHGRPLAVDGKLGPLTTSAIKAWQRKNGMKPTGAVTSADLAKLTARKPHRKAALLKPKPKPSQTAPMRR